MKKISLWFVLLCKRQIKNIVLAILLIAMPVAALVVRLVPAMSETDSVIIGVLIEADDDVSNGIRNSLYSLGDNFEFSLCSSYDELTNNVFSGNLACGYVISGDIESKLMNSDYKNIITQVVKEQNTVTDTSNELMFSAVLNGSSAYLAYSYMSDNNLIPSSQISNALKDIKAETERLHSSGSTLSISYKTMTSLGEVSNDVITSFDSTTFPLRGMIAIVVFIACLLGISQWITDKQNYVLAPMSSGFITISRFLYVIVPAIMFAASGIISIFISGISQNVMLEIGAMLLFIAVNAIVGFILTFVIKKSNTLMALLPVIIICSLIVCPVFVDLSNLLPVIGIINKCFPPFYYLMFF